MAHRGVGGPPPTQGAPAGEKGGQDPGRTVPGSLRRKRSCKRSRKRSRKRSHGITRARDSKPGIVSQVNRINRVRPARDQPPYVLLIYDSTARMSAPATAVTPSGTPGSHRNSGTTAPSTATAGSWARNSPAATHPWTPGPPGNSTAPCARSASPGDRGTQTTQAQTSHSNRSSIIMAAWRAVGIDDTDHRAKALERYQK